MKSEQERKETRQFRELRKENIRLKRQIAEMKKELRLTEQQDSDEDGELELVPVDFSKSYSCPLCEASHTRIFQLLGRDYYRCETCGSKGPKK